MRCVWSNWSWSCLLWLDGSAWKIRKDNMPGTFPADTMIHSQHAQSLFHYSICSSHVMWYSVGAWIANRIFMTCKRLSGYGWTCWICTPFLVDLEFSILIIFATVQETNFRLPESMLAWRRFYCEIRSLFCLLGNWAGYFFTGDVVMEPFVFEGGTVGREIKVWRDLSDHADEARLDQEAKNALEFSRYVIGKI